MTASSVAFFRNLNVGQLADAVGGRRLAPVCPYDDVVLVRSVDWLRDLAVGDLQDDCDLTLFDGPTPFPEALPWEPGRGDVTVLDAG